MAKTAKLKTLYNPRNPDEQWLPRTTKEAVGLANVDNTADMDKPVSTAMQEALSAKADKLDHTAQEIDSAVSRALPGGEIDGLLAGKAPSGLVSARYETVVESEVDTILQAEYASMENRSLRFIAIDINVQGEVFTGGAWHFTLYRTTETYGVISAISYSGISGKSSTVMSNTLYAGEWTGWIFENPPMQLGKEYRTTERYLGKPVYAKVVSFGALPNSTEKAVAHGSSNIAAFASLSMSLTHDNGAKASIVSHADIKTFMANEGHIIIGTTADMSAYSSVYVTMKYTKTTD